jgi:hypothetical protein
MSLFVTEDGRAGPLSPAATNTQQQQQQRPGFYNGLGALVWQVIDMVSAVR